MSGYLIDTNVISELRKGDRADAGVRRWFDQHVTDELWLSVLVVAELGRGVELLRRRDQAAAAALEDWLQSLIDDFSDRILPVDVRVAQRWALLGIPDPLPVVDGLLAATALVHQLTLITRNTRDVERSGVKFENPFL